MVDPSTPTEDGIVDSEGRGESEVLEKEEGTKSQIKNGMSNLEQPGNPPDDDLSGVVDTKSKEAVDDEKLKESSRDDVEIVENGKKDEPFKEVVTATEESANAVANDNLRETTTTTPAESDDQVDVSDESLKAEETGRSLQVPKSMSPQPGNDAQAEKDSQPPTESKSNGSTSPASTNESAKKEKTKTSKKVNKQAEHPPIDENRATKVALPPAKGSTTGESTEDSTNDVLLVELQSSLQEHMQHREEAEEKARKMEKRVRECEERLRKMASLEEEVEKLTANVEELNSEKSHMEYEMSALEQSRDEHERKANVLSNRLNTAKKKEGIKANLAEELDGENKELQAQLSNAQKELIMLTAEKDGLEIEMEALKKKCIDRVKSAEGALEEEHRLNGERKKKMKIYIETKAEELRVAKGQNDEYHVEVEQMQISLRETNERWKQLHAQWVQSQTRNRELQRDLNRIKKDSDNLHKLGDNLEMKLSQSATEAEEHKNKRLSAKHELMTILRKLEAERSVSARLRDSVKFTFTPKALSQQQLLNESLSDFEAELMKLSRRLGKPLPPPTNDPAARYLDETNTASSTPLEPIGEAEGENESTDGGTKKSRSEIDSSHLLSNLENETQRVSQCIMALISNIERMHLMLEEGDRTCMTALTDLLAGAHANSISDERASITGSAVGQSRAGRRKYDTLPSS